jgi:hypothetical protein
MRVALAVAVREWLTPSERAAVHAARAVAPSDGEDTQRFSERDRLVVLGVIRPVSQRRREADHGGNAR